jgi:hypothetical protein
MFPCQCILDGEFLQRLYLPLCGETAGSIVAAGIINTDRYGDLLPVHGASDFLLLTDNELIPVIAYGYPISPRLFYGRSFA